MNLSDAFKAAGEHVANTWEKTDAVKTQVVKGNDKYEHIYLQLNSIGEFNIEELLLADYFGHDKITHFYPIDVEKGLITITDKDFVSGEVPTMKMIFDKLGVDYSFNDYPESLHKYMHRKVWSDTLYNVKKNFIESNESNPVFIKPKDGLKKFTGFVLKSVENDKYKLINVDNNMEVWCCEPVEFVSEYRVPVIEGNIRGCAYYKGQKVVYPDISVIQSAIDDFKDSPKAYCLDFGVLSTGETALVEVNDAYGIGYYDMMNPTIYAGMLMTRWDELMSSIKK